MIKNFFIVICLNLAFLLPLCVAGEFEDLKQNCIDHAGSEEALSVCLKCMELNPNDAQVNWLLGRAYDKKGEIDTAINYYKKAVELKPDSLMANFSLAFCYETKSTDPTRAHAIYERILSLNPKGDNPTEKFILKMTYQGLGNSYNYDKKQYDKAVVYYKKSYDIEPNAFICEKIASSYKALEDYAKELEWRNEAIKLSGSDCSSYSLRGSAYYRLGNYEKAMADYRKAIELDPAQPHAYYNMGLIYEANENLPEAIKYFQQSYDRYKDENQKAKAKSKIEELQAELAAPPGLGKFAVKLGLPTDRNSFENLLGDHREEIIKALNYFREKDESKAYETLNAIKETHLKLKEFSAEYRRSKHGSKTDFDYYLNQAGPHVENLVAYYERVQEDYREQKEQNIKNAENAPREIAERHQDTEKPKNFEDILDTLDDFKEWKVVTDYRKSLDLPSVRIEGPNAAVVFYDLPVDASSLADQPLMIHAKIDRQVDDGFLISNYDDKEALADISKKLIAKGHIKYGEYYYMACRMTDVVTVNTVGGSQKPVAVVEVDAIIPDDQYRQFACYVAGHPDEFPYKKYLVIENIEK